MKNEICAYAQIKGFSEGTFKQIWHRYGNSDLSITGDSLQESKKIHEDWVKGLGIRTRKHKGFLKQHGFRGSMIIIRIKDFSKLRKPIHSETIKGLIRRPISSFAIITRSQAKKIMTSCF